jgi:hypothetical protein
VAVASPARVESTPVRSMLLRNCRACGWWGTFVVRLDMRLLFRECWEES